LVRNREKLNKMNYENLTDTEKKLYSEIELLIIRWNIDGTKTAGSLTRQIMEVYQKHNLKSSDIIDVNYTCCCGDESEQFFFRIC